MLSTSQRAPGYRFQYHVPPIALPASRTRTEYPSLRNRWRAYRPAKPAPMTITSNQDVLFSRLITDLPIEPIFGDAPPTQRPEPYTFCMLTSQHLICSPSYARLWGACTGMLIRQQIC